MATREERLLEARAKLERARERRAIFTSPSPTGSNIREIIVQAEALQARTAAHAAEVRARRACRCCGR